MSAPEIPAILLNPHYNDRYFDVIDGFEEAKYVFIRGSRIVERLSLKPAESRILSIGETGFGVGRTLAALIDEIDTSGIRHYKIEYNSVELHPISIDQMREILYQLRGCSRLLADQIADCYAKINTAQPGLHSCFIPGSFGTITVNLWIGEALEMVNALAHPVDAWFLDGHGPKTNPSMWRSELLMAIGSKTAPGGTAATFTVAGHVRRSLASAGFLVNRFPGIGAKKTVLQAQFQLQQNG